MSKKRSLKNTRSFEEKSGLNPKNRIKLLVEDDKYFKFVSILPAMLLMMVIVVYPLFSLLHLSLTNTNAFNIISGDAHLIGLKNFIFLFRDGIFLKSIFNTIYFVVVSVSLEFIFGVFLAALVYPMKRSLKNLIIALVLIPTMIADVAVGLVWKTLLNVSTGIINYFIQLMGFGSISFLGNKDLAMIAIILIAVWQWTPFLFLFILAGMESLKTTYFEVAKLEGASLLQTWIHIILPLIKPVILVALFFRVTASIRVFDKVYVLTGGGPGSASETISTYIRRVAFVDVNFGLASAGGVVMLLIALVIGFISLKYMYKVNEF